MKKSIAVITGTVGSSYLKECVLSVKTQRLRNADAVHIEHWVVIDGPEFREKVEEVLGKSVLDTLKVIQLPQNTGATGGQFNAHRIYGSVPYLASTDYVAFLDEDNAFDPDHLQGLLDAIGSTDSEWAFSFRSIVDRDGNFITNDACESLGSIQPSVLGTQDFFIDTNCYLLARNLAISTSMVWNVPARPAAHQLEADRALSNVLINVAKLPHGVSRKHSVRYRVASTSKSVRKEFFLKNNPRVQFDAGKQDLYLFLLTPQATAAYFATRHATDRSYALDEWQPTLCRRLTDTFNVINGYHCLETLPPGAKVLCVLWHPSSMPMTFFRERKDLVKCVYTLESPNIRHKDQWDPLFLAEHFDVALTYWAPLLTNPPSRLKTVFCAHNCHHLDLELNHWDRKQLRENPLVDTSVAIVLERRGLQGITFTIHNTLLKCLDPLREKYVVGLKDITCYGIGWEKYADDPIIKVGHSMHRSKDPQASVDILQKYTFALIVENVNAEGYVSEKMYDALLAGCIPLYYGNPIPQLNIPPEVFVDIRQFEDGYALQEWLDTLTTEDIKLMKKNVLSHRERVLQQVGCQAFAQLVDYAFTV